MKYRNNTRKRITAKRIFKWFESDAEWHYPKAVTPSRLARTVDKRGCTAMHYAAHMDKYPKGTTIRHLILAEKYMKRRNINLAKKFSSGSQYSFDNACANSTPLEIAIRTGKIPAGTTRHQLEQAQTLYGTGWEMAVRQLRSCETRSRDLEDARIFGSQILMQRLPELFDLLNPMIRRADLQIIESGVGPTLFDGGFVIKEKMKDWIGNYTLQFHPDFALHNLHKLFPPAECASALKKCLLGKLPAVPGVYKSAIRAGQMGSAEGFARCIFNYPELESVLQRRIKLHAAILDYIADHPDLIPPELRGALARHPEICAAML